MTKPLHDLYDAGEDNLSWDAAIEQFALIACLHFRSRESAERIMRQCQPNGEILSWFIRDDQEDDTERLVPSHMLVRQRGRYFIAISGTESKRQWAQNFAGAFVRRGFGPDGEATVHGYFAWCADRVYERLTPLMPFRSITPVNVAGHSLGGATANLLAYRLKADHPTSAVNVVTYGEPRSMGSGYAGPEPDRKWRVINGYDPVTEVPPNGVVTTLLGTVVPLVAMYGYTGWRHTGVTRWIGEDGKVYGEEPPRGRVEPAASDRRNERVSHFAEAHIRSLASIHKAYGTSPESAAVLAVAAQAYGGKEKSDGLGLPDPDRFIDIGVLNGALTGGSSAPFTAENWRSFTLSSVEPTTAQVGPDALWLSGFSGNKAEVAIMADTPITSLWRIIAQLNNLHYGSSHSVVIRGPRNAQEAIAAGKKWVALRAALLGSNQTSTSRAGGDYDPDMGTPMYEYMTVQNALDPRNSTPVLLNRNIGAPYAASALGNTPADVMSSAFSIRMEGLSETSPAGRSYHVESFVGFPDLALFNGRVKWDTPVAVGKTFRSAMDEYISLLTGNDQQFGFMGVNPSIPKRDITAFAVAADASVLITIPGDPYVDGDTLRLTGQVGAALRKDWTIARQSTGVYKLLGSAMREEDLPRKGKAQRVRLANGTRELVFFRFQTPKAIDTSGGYLVKVTKRNLRPKSIPVSFAQKGR